MAAKGRSCFDKLSMIGLLALPLLFSVPAGARAEDLSSLQALFLRGDYDGVVREVRRLDRRGGTLSDGALYLWGVSAIKLNNPQEGRQALNRLVTRYEGSRWRAQALLALGRSWEEAGRDEEALKIYQSLLERERSGSYFSQGALRLAKAQMRLGLWRESRSTLDLLLQRAPQSPEAAAARDLAGNGSFYYCVQVGAFSAELNAERLAGDLKQRGYVSEINRGVLDGKVLYRVRVGRFQSKEEAEASLKKLREEGFPGKVFP